MLSFTTCGKFEDVCLTKPPRYDRPPRLSVHRGILLLETVVVADYTTACAEAVSGRATHTWGQEYQDFADSTNDKGDGDGDNTAGNDVVSEDSSQDGRMDKERTRIH